MVQKFLYGAPANAGEPWSEMALSDLRDGLAQGRSVEDIADFLQRTVEEVEARMKGLSNG